jgi:hypothetical protein
LPSTVSGTELSAQEFRDALSMRYGEAPPDLPACCDGCDAPFKPSRVKESAKDTPTKDTSPEKQEEQRATGEDERGDILIRGFWARGTDCILDVRVTGTDTKTYCKRDPAKVLESQEKEKKRKYLEVCLERRHHFPLRMFCGWHVWMGGQTFAKQPAAKLTNKLEKWFSSIYANARLSIAIVRATHLCMRGSRVLLVHKISIRYPQWEDGAGFSLFKC